METVLHRYNPWWENGFDPSVIDYIERRSLQQILSESIHNNQVILITGLRRIGKTSLLKLIVKHLIQHEISPASNILYVSLDDYLLINNSIIEIVEVFRKINNLKFSDRIYLFLDEVTYKTDHQLQLKNLYDHHNAKVFASSSSASLLKSEISRLTGRHFTYELLPLDFNEYMRFKNLHFNKEDSHLVEKHFHEFLTTGGIPEFVLEEQIEYLQNLVDDIISKDIAATHRISNLKLLKEFFLLLMERAGKQSSINKIANILKISPDTSSRYLNLFAETFLINEVPRHGRTNERILAPKKFYAADLGIRSMFTGKRDFGSLFENYVYLKTKHLQPEYIYKNGIELDFYTGNALIECKYHDKPLSPKQEKLYNEMSAQAKYIFRTHDDIEKYLAHTSA